MEYEFIGINLLEPDKLERVEALTKDGEILRVYKCGCQNVECKTWRSSRTDEKIYEEIVEWRYLKK